MTALRKIRTEENFAAATAVCAPAAKLYVVPTNAPVATEAPAAGNLVKNVALFLAAPFIGLVYVIALPIVGLAVMVMLAGRAAAKFNAVKVAGRAAKTVAMAIGAPFAGLAFVVFFPVIGLAGLLWVGGKALAVRD